MPRIGVIGNSGGWSSERLADAVEAKTGSRYLIDAGEVGLDLATGKVFAGGLDLREMDALIIKKLGRGYAPDQLDRLEILRYLSETSTPVFSRPDRIIRVLDRLACTVTLRLHGIPMPPTVITERREEAADAVRRFGRAVFKPLFTSKARGMLVIEDGPDAADRIGGFQKAGNRVMYIQKMIEHPGHDLGVTFLGGKYVATYARVGRDGSWNTSIVSDGEYRAHEPDPGIVELARKAQAGFGLDFTSVDVAETGNGPVVFEVSAFGGFRGLTEAHGLDPAALYTDHVLKNLSNG
jgi:ribosomal protein S6--L-glutamate ligase